MAKADVLRRVRQNLFSERSVEHPFLQEATAPALTTDTTITVNDGAAWEAGDTLEWEETGELCYVRSVSTNDLTVIRGFGGTTAQAITDAVPLVRKNPQFTQQEIEDQYDHILNSLWNHGIFAWGTQAIVVDTTTNPQKQLLTNHDLRDIVSITVDSTLDETPEIHVPWRAQQAGSNVQIMMYWPAETDGTASAVLTYKDRITDIDTDDIRAGIEQILEDGVTYRVMASTMASRLHDPGQLTDRTVQPGQGGRDARFYQGEFVLGVRRMAQELKVEVNDRRAGSDLATSKARRWRV